MAYTATPLDLVLKKCTQCPDGGAFRPLECFGADRSRPDGKQQYCKSCRAHKHKRRRLQLQKDDYCDDQQAELSTSDAEATTQESEDTELSAGSARSDSLYIFQNSLLPHMLKIGRSCNPFARASSLQASQPFIIRVMAVYPDAGGLESSVHRLLAYCRVTGGAGREWFECSLPTACGAIALALEAAQSRED